MIASILALTLLTAPATETPTSKRRVALEIDYAALLEAQEVSAAEETVTFLREDGVAALENVHGADVVDDAGAPAIIVHLAWVNYSESVYRITLSTRRAGEEPRMLDAMDCACIDSGVIKAVLGRLPEALAQLDEEFEAVAEPTAPVEPEPRPEPEPETPPPSGDRPLEDSDQPSKPIAGLGIAGGFVALGGLGMMGFGISRLGMGRVSDGDPGDEESILVQDFRPQGRAWLGIGAGVTVAGAAMLVVDLTVLRRRRNTHLAVHPIGGPSWTGLQLQGRF